MSAYDKVLMQKFVLCISIYKMLKISARVQQQHKMIKCQNYAYHK